MDTLYCAPGNAGIAQIATCVPIKATDLDAMVRFAVTEAIDLVFVAPDDPLALGMVDALQQAGIRAFGPSRAAARIEASKSFAKDLMRRYQIPTADYAVFDSVEPALAHLKSCDLPIVIKADGLALGDKLGLPLVGIKLHMLDRLGKGAPADKSQTKIGVRCCGVAHVGGA